MDLEFDGYRLLEPLGAAARDDGAAATPNRDPARARVWRAVRTDDDAPVVIKVFAAAHAERAEREAALAAAIDHPHLLRGAPVAGRDGAVGLVFPYLDGGSLASLIAARRRLRWPELLTVLIPLADALAAAHERGLVHGDVSPGNVLFDADGRPVLADFGAARAAAECGSEVQVTPQHVAPEIVRGANPSPAADLFSLGSVALACLTGRAAWPADDLQDVLIQSTAGQWPELEDNMAPGPLRTVVRRLLEPEPDDRGSAAQLAVELRRIGDPEPVTLLAAGADPALPAPGAATVVRPDAVRPPSAHVQQRRRHRRGLPSLGERLSWVHLSWRGVVAAAAVTVLAVGAVGLGQWWNSDQAAIEPTVVQSAEPTSGSTEPTSSSPDPEWSRIVAALDEARSAAFAARDAAQLDAVYASGSPERDADAERIAALRDAGLRPDGARHRVMSVRVAELRADGSAVLAVVEDQPATALYDAGGTQVGHSPAIGKATMLLDVGRTSGGYRINGVHQG
jgi:hypothetical protein